MTQPEGSSRDDLPCFEDALAELEAIVHQLEEGELGLEESLARYEAGVKHLKHCFALLQQAERKVELLTRVQGDGTPVTAPFVEGTPAPDESARRRPRLRKHKSPPGLFARGDEEESADMDD
jgi:exodeoxyribonuclease VII small subunit